jgi:hypothetical protein
MNTAPEHCIEVLENVTLSASEGAYSCVWGNDVTVDPRAIERSVNACVEDVDVDLLVVLASVAFADRRVKRRNGLRWGRSLVVRVPVHDPALWMQAGSALESVLAYLSGDTWRFDFRQRNHNEHLQLFLGRRSPHLDTATVIPTSGGLDSLTVVRRRLVEHPEAPLVLVSGNGRVPHADSRSANVRGFEVPFRIHPGRHAEPSYRTRTFTFFCLAALACRHLAGAKVLIGENGIGCMGPSLVPFGIEHPVRGCHPSYLAKLRTFLTRLWGSCPLFELPHLWMTKGEVLRELQGRGQLEGWEQTRSCSRNVRRQHPGSDAPQCGVCSGCMYRRQSLHHAGLHAKEPSGTYFSDVIADAALPSDANRADREVATYAALGLASLAKETERWPKEGPYAADLAHALGRPLSEVATSVRRLLAAHADEWARFLDALPRESWVRAHAAAAQAGAMRWTRR